MICLDLRYNEQRPFYDLAILDMEMPSKNGAELAKEIKADDRFKDLKLVMMTSVGESGDLEYFASIGFSAYFSKPANMDNLIAALAVVADAGEPLQQATPLVTSHYIQSLKHLEDGFDPSEIRFPESVSILLVEDNMVNREVILGLLEENELQVDCVENGAEAIERLKASDVGKEYSVVLMDCQMPVLDGFEATRAIRTSDAGDRYQSVPVIAMTAHAGRDAKDDCISAGMNDYLSKPVDYGDLISSLCKWLQVTEQ
jgi:CheY-like chemotaxis protein